MSIGQWIFGLFSSKPEPKTRVTVRMKYKERDEERILDALEPLFQKHERHGDFIKVLQNIEGPMDLSFYTRHGALGFTHEARQLHLPVKYYVGKTTHV